MNVESFSLAELLASQSETLVARMAAELRRNGDEQRTAPLEQLELWLEQIGDAFCQSMASDDPRPLTSCFEAFVRQRVAAGGSHHSIQQVADVVRRVLLSAVDETCAASPRLWVACARKIENLAHLLHVTIINVYVAAHNETFASQQRELLAAYEQARQRADEMSSFSTINLAISSTVELDEVLRRIIENARRLLQAEIATIYLWEKLTREYTQRGVIGSEYRRERVPPPRSDGHTSQIMRTGLPLIIPDTWQDPGVSAATLEHGIRATIGIPIRVEDDNIGVFYVHGMTPRPFTEHDILLLTTLARQAAVAIQNARLFAEERYRREQLRLINQVGWQISSIMDPEELMWRIATLIRETFDYYYVSLSLVEGDELVLCAPVGGRDERAREACGMRLKLGQQGITGWVAASGQSIIVPDVSAEPRYYAAPELADSRSVIAVPLKTRGEIIGVLSIEESRLDAFDQDTQALLQVLADQAAIAISNAQLYNVEQRRRRWAEALAQAGRELSSSLDLREVPSRILVQLNAVVPYERGAVMLQHDGALQIIAQRGFPEDERVMAWRISICENDVFQQIVTTCRPVVVDDITRLTSWPQVEWLSVNLSWLGVPLISKDEVTGVISLTRREAGAFGTEEATLVSAFAGQAAVALENARLYDQIMRFNEQLEQMVEQRTEELNKAYRTLEQLDKTKSDFIEVSAHELRTPLTLIKGYAQLLEASVKDRLEARPLLEGILAGQSRLHEVVNSMLDVTRIDSQTLDMRQEFVNLLGIIENVRGGFGAALEERRLTLTLTNLDVLPTIRADPDLVYKLFYHLIVNAIKYTPDGGAITVSGRVVELCEGSQPSHSFVEIAVCDTGIGIDPEHRELIFEKFYQTGKVAFHSSGKTKFKGGGPGLGLAIARGIVQAHCGRIWVESERHDEVTCPGSCFHVLLPVSG